METSLVHKDDYRNQPEMIAILLCCLLYKLGGQLTMTLGEINTIFSDFPEIRMALKRADATGLLIKPEFQEMTVTLRSREMVEEGKA